MVEVTAGDGGGISCEADKGSGSVTGDVTHHAV